LTKLNSLGIIDLELVEDNTKELIEFERVCFPLLGFHIYNNFGYIRYNVWEGREENSKRCT